MIFSFVHKHFTPLQPSAHLRTATATVAAKAISSVRALPIAALLVASVATALPVSAADTISYEKMPSGKYALDKTHASLHWKISHLGLSGYTARFTSFDASFTFDAKQPQNSQLSATIDPGVT